MIKLYIFTFVYTIIFSACVTPYPVKKIHDRVKKTYVLSSSGEITSRSKIYNLPRKFLITAYKYSDQPDKLFLSFRSHYDITSVDYKDSLFMVFPNRIDSHTFYPVSNNVKYQEHKQIVKTNTTTQVNTESKIEKGSTADETSQNQVVQTTTTSTNSDVRVSSDIMDKIFSHRQIEISSSDFKYFFNTPIVKIQIYNVTGDFWVLPLHTNYLKQWQKLLKGECDYTVWD